MTVITTEFLLLSSILKTRLYEVYPNMIIALRITLNCPDAVSSPETSFSKLKLIKTFNRSHMTDSRLSSLAMSIEASCVCSLDLDDVIKVFSGQKTRSKSFWYYNNVIMFMIFSWLWYCNIFHAWCCAAIQYFFCFAVWPRSTSWVAVR